MASPYHFRGQNPHSYKHDDGSIRISSLTVDISDLYPPGFVEKHGDNAKTMLMSLSYGQRYPHLWYCNETYTPMKRKVDGKLDKSCSALCLICRETYSIAFNEDGTYNTRNLFTHIAKQHPTFLLPEDVLFLGKEEASAIDTQKQSKKSKPSDPWNAASRVVEKKLSDSKDLRDLSKDITALATEMISDCFLPFSLIENYAFREFVRALIDKVTGQRNKVRFQTRRALRGSVRKYVSSSVQIGKRSFMSDIDATSGKSNSKACFYTTDGTTARNKYHYLALTSSRLKPLENKDAVMQDYILACSVDKGRQNEVHSFEFFAKSIEQLFSVEIIDWNIDENGKKSVETYEEGNKKKVVLDRVKGIKPFITAVTLDDGAGTCAAVLRDLGIEVLCCVGHKLHNLFKACIGSNSGDGAIKLAIMPIYEVLNYIRSSNVAIEELRRVQDSQGWKRYLLPIECPMHKWGFHLRGLKRWLKLVGSVNQMNIENMWFRTPARKQQYQDSLATANANHLYLDYLLPFFERLYYWIARTEYAGEVTVSIVLYMIDDLKAYTSHAIDIIDQTPMNHDMKTKLRDCFNHFLEEQIFYFKNKHTHKAFYDIELYKVAELLDPRFAKNSRSGEPGYFSKTLLNFYDHDRIRELVVPTPTDDPVEQQAVGEIFPEMEPQEDEQQQRIEQSRAVEQREKYRKEVVEYKKIIVKFYESIGTDEVKLREHRDNFNVKKFWAEQDKPDKLPIMSQLAFRVLEIQSQSSSSERCFNGLTVLLNKQRSSIDKDLAGDLTVNYMMKHKKGGSKLLKLPPFGRDWPEGEKNRVAMPHLEDQDYDEDDLGDGGNTNDEEDEEVREEEVIEEVIYAEDIVIDETEEGALRPRRGGDRVNYRNLAGYR